MRRTVLALLLAGCGAPTETGIAEELGSVSYESKRQEERCTSDTLKPGWECCDDDGLRCFDRTIMVCVNHKWADLSDEHCHAIMTDPRRPEMASYGTLCDHDGDIWDQCHMAPTDMRIKD